MSELIGFGENDEDVLTGDLDRYKGVKNQTDRIALVWFFRDENGDPRMDETATPQFKAVNYHYVPGLGYIASKGKFTTEKFGPPKRRIGTFIVKYKTDRSGNLPKNAEGKAELDFDIMEWHFGDDKYRLLSPIHSEYPLTTHDLKVTCTDDQFQKLSFTPCSGQALWQRKPEIRDRVLAKVEELESKMQLCRDMSIKDIKEALGESESVAAPPEATGDIDFESLVEDLA